MIQVNITFRDPSKISWIRIQQLALKVQSCETYLELENMLGGLKEEVTAEYINIPSEKKKMPVPVVRFRQMSLCFTPEE